MWNSLLMLLLAGAPPVQDLRGSEVIVTGSRRSADGYDEHIPAVGLRRPADFAVQPVVVRGDTRDPAKRTEEIYATVRAAVDLAVKRGDIELATGEVVVEPLTLGNYRHLTIGKDDRPDSGKVEFLVKVRLVGSDAKTAIERINAFVKAVPVVGRAQIETNDDLTLSVVDPDQYRGRIVDLVAADAHATAAKLGPEYVVEARGLDRPVEWSRAGLTEVFLYVPYSYTVVPKR
jgi:hypothetical protein